MTPGQADPFAMTLLVIEIPRTEAADFEPGRGVSKSEAVPRLWHFLAQQQIPWFLTGLVGNLTGRVYRGGGWQRLRPRPS
jgi:hypothetical protein